MPTVVASSKSRRARKQTSDADRELIQTSFKRFKISSEAESESRNKGLEDLKFSIGTGQWDEAVRANREIEGKPCLTMNRAPTFLRQFTGEERQHRPAMIVDPVGDGADADVALIHQGVLRHIETVSFADTVYDNAFDMMLRIGWANWRVDMDYLDEMSFLQEPRIVGIENPFAVYMSPIRKPDGSDPLWCHVVQDLGKDEYKEKHGDSKLGSMTSFPTTLGNAEPGWVTKDGVRIAEYWYLELESAQLVKLDTGESVLRSKLPKNFDKARIADERETVLRKVCWIKHNAMEVLERREYLGKYIPILELNGVRLNVNGTIYKAGFVRDYRDAQRIYDFMVTRAVEQVDLTGKDPLLVAFGSIDGREEEYRQMNRKNYPYLYYRAYDKDGKQLPPPTRANREPPIQAMHALVQQADYDMKAIVGIYGTGPGENATSNESAFAVLTRQQQTDTGMVNWTDNLSRTIRWQGKICVDLWPKYIDSARVQRIINPDDSVKHVAVYNSQMDGTQEDAQALFNDSVKKAYDIGVGTYDVSLSTGPQYRTARQEAFRAIGAVVTAQPQLFPILGDIWIKYADWPGAHVLSERLKKMLPPNLQEQDDTDPKIQVLNLQGQLQALGQQQQQLVAELARATDTIRTNRLDIESKERISLAKNQSDMAIAQLKANADGALQHLQATQDAIAQRLEALHASMSVETEAGQAPVTPELPNKVEPHVQPVTPATPTVPVPGTSGGL